MEITLRSIGLCGIILFGLLLLLTFSSAKHIEKSARGFVKYQIELELRQQQKEVTSSATAKMAVKFGEKLSVESAKIERDLAAQLPEKIANVLAKMCGYDCERKKMLANSITSSYFDRLKNIRVAQDTLGDIVKGKYLEIVANLKFDLRIFLTSNLAMFSILLIISFTRRQAIAHLFLPAVLLLVATIVASSIYIFGQDWFYSILYNDYMGFGYLLYLAAIFSLLVDIVFNRARATTETINAILNAIGSSLSLLPC
ncbi:hypothetical protein [Catenovulum agarivorans]|uniref:hypothetical protein n=1 Tax=Catenovulum agarivorans TaxID=1172192 RepID=UPI0002FAB68D|nr:hypothetical protein [Catenovulum agarivorans]